MLKHFELEDSNYSKLNSVRMLCDKPLTKRKIKEPFLNQSFFYLIVGKAGSGKSTFLFQLLTTKGADQIYRKVFKNILYVCPKNSRGSIDNNPLADLAEDSLFDNLSLDVQYKIIDNKKTYDETPEKNYNQLLIIDDCSAFLKNKYNIQMLNELSMNRRHMNLSLILLVQYVISVPASVRSQISCITLFKPSNNKDYQTLKKEFLNMENKEFMDFVNFVFKEKHDNLFINMETNDMYKNLQKIIINP